MGLGVLHASCVIVSPCLATRKAAHSLLQHQQCPGTLRIHRDARLVTQLRPRPVSAGSGRRAASRPLQAQASLQALVFDCDGVILESEDLHRQAYNATFQHFNVRCEPFNQVVDWSTEFYDELQNLIGGGKPKMRWYFNKNGWPTSSVSVAPPVTPEACSSLLDTLQDWKTAKYMDMIGSGMVPPRPGVLRLMDEAADKGLKLAVCSAATKESVVFTLRSLLGPERVARLDCFLAGDDVSAKKPDPSIYRRAAEILRVAPAECLVVEDSVIGLQAATGAGMRCIITYTPSTQKQEFAAAEQIHESLATVRLEDLINLPCFR